jgi:hypothetical protein
MYRRSHILGGSSVRSPRRPGWNAWARVAGALNQERNYGDSAGLQPISETPQFRFSSLMLIASATHLPEISAPWLDRELGVALAYFMSQRTKQMRCFLLICTAITCFAGGLIFRSSEANAISWRGITAPTNIDIHGWPIIKEPPPSPCQWIRLSGGYYVRQCIY